MPGQINIDKGGSMRLGDWRCQIFDGKILDLYTEVYGRKDYYLERHRHRLEVQPKYISELEKIGYKIVGRHYSDQYTSQNSEKEDFFIDLENTEIQSEIQSETAKEQSKKYPKTQKATVQNQSDHFLVEMIELADELHPYFVATQSHPEFLGRPGRPHPLFLGLIRSAQL
jgi:CTP synthase (UTP-ammonia lyase)